MPTPISSDGSNKDDSRRGNRVREEGASIRRTTPEEEARRLLEALNRIGHLPSFSITLGGMVDLGITTKRHKEALTCDVRRLGRPGSYAIEAAAARAAIWMKDGALTSNAVIIIVPELSARTLRQVERGIDRVHKVVGIRNLAVLSQRGGHIFRFGSWDLHEKAVDAASQGIAEGAGGGGTSLVFSEANEQLLKTLVYELVRGGSISGDLVKGWWPRHPEPLISIERWADACEVGRTTAYRLYKVLLEDGLIGKADGFEPLRITNLGRLLTNWLESERRAPSRRLIPMVPLYPPKGNHPGGRQQVMAWLDSLAMTIQANGSLLALTGWKALEHHGLGAVVGVTPITVEVPTEQHLETLTSSILPAGQRQEAWAYISVMRRWRAVAMGITPRDKRIPVVDPWQAALDIAGDPNRGWEQAEAIAKRFVDMAIAP